MLVDNNIGFCRQWATVNLWWWSQLEMAQASTFAARPAWS